MSVEAWLGLVALMTTIVGAALVLSWRMATVTTTVERALSDLEGDLKALKGELTDARSGRAHLWREINPLRERVAVVEARCGINHTEIKEDRRG